MANLYQKFLKKKEFWDSSFYVNKHVLDPRPETEHIIESINKYFPNMKKKMIISDFGTGSGCIIISLLKMYYNSFGIGIDISLRAIDIAKSNSKNLNLVWRTKFIHCDVDNFNFGNYDVVVSNPLYICSHRINYLSEDIKFFEPRMALDGGSSGLETISKVIITAKKLLKTRGYLFIEIGNRQSHAVSSMLIKSKFRIVKKFFDYRKTIRCIMSTKII